MSRYLYGFGNGASYCLGATRKPAPSLVPNGPRVVVHGRYGVPTWLGPYPTREEAAIVAQHVMGQSWCVALVEGAS